MAGDYVGKMTEEEIKQWDNLYQYVKKEIMQYNDDQSLSSQIVLMLKGISTGKLIENKKIQDNAKYSYDIVLRTFQICRQNILNSVKGKSFNSENTKFIYISKIIENNINDVYIRLQNIEKSDQNIEYKKMDRISHNGAEYISKSKESNKKLEELW